MTRRGPDSGARAVARTNIALAKYWGKCDVALNLPAVPSVSLTLDGLVTETRVSFRRNLGADRLVLDGARRSDGALDRATRVLDDVRRLAGTRLAAEVVTANNFPTASGLASSASGFAALVGASLAAVGHPRDRALESRLARRASASAARSIYGGFVTLAAGTPGDDSLAARPLLAPDAWDVRLVVAVTTEGAKAVGSTEGMERSRRTSPAYGAWLAAAPRLARTIRAAVRRRDLEVLGQAMEQSTFLFHGTAQSAVPPIVYFQPATLAAYAVVRALRDGRGVPVFATMDAGPHVKALTTRAHAAAVARALRRAPGVVRVLVAAPGEGLEVSR